MGENDHMKIKKDFVANGNVHVCDKFFSSLFFYDLNSQLI